MDQPMMDAMSANGNMYVSQGPGLGAFEWLRNAAFWLSAVSAAVLALSATRVSGATQAQLARVKDVATIEGIRDNQLVGYGLVVGLRGTGDSSQTVFPAQ